VITAGPRPSIAAGASLAARVQAPSFIAATDTDRLPSEQPTKTPLGQIRSITREAIVPARDGALSATSDLSRRHGYLEYGDASNHD
jgi:hypothetical protein